jgi:hemoglobin-like flavoprotein
MVDDYEFRVKAEKWFEGFQKQLQELDEMLTIQKANDDVIQAWRNGRHALIKEVLGVEPKVKEEK